jgi:hypothetical protein
MRSDQFQALNSRCPAFSVLVYDTLRMVCSSRSMLLARGQQYVHVMSLCLRCSTYADASIPSTLPSQQRAWGQLAKLEAQVDTSITRLLYVSGRSGFYRFYANTDDILDTINGLPSWFDDIMQSATELPIIIPLWIDGTRRFMPESRRSHDQVPPQQSIGETITHAVQPQMSSCSSCTAHQMHHYALVNVLVAT